MDSFLFMKLTAAADIAMWASPCFAFVIIVWSLCLKYLTKIL